ncbi:MAG: glycosyltransferase family 1 protein, partial [Calditrichaeota bacterium]
MNQKTIAFFCPSKSWGGLEMNVLRIALWMQEAGSRILLYADPDSQLYSEAYKTSLPLISFISESKFSDLKNAAKLKKSLTENNVDIILFHLNRNFPLLALIKIMMKDSIKTAYVQHMQLGANKKDLIHKVIYSRLDCWIAPLNMFKKSLVEYTSIPESKISVVPFGIELDRFTEPKRSREEARKLLKLPLNKTILGFVGRIDPKKCQHTLIEAAHLLIQQEYDIEILLVGDKSKNEHDQYVKKIEEMITEYNLIKKIHLREHFKEIEAAYKAIDIFILTSSAETFGMVTIEAMASGLPVIGTNSGGTPEITEDNKTGLLFEPENAPDLAEKLKIL